MVDGSSFESMPMYAIFAAQILLDINHRLRSNVSYPLNRLRIAGETAIDSVDQHFQHVDGQCQAEMRNTKDEELKDIKVYTEEWIQTDAIGAAFSKGTASQATIPPFRFFRNHPMLCGLKVFRLQMLLQGIGIGLCNAWGSVIFPAHLYNAVACSMEEHLRWIDLIYIVSLHSAKRVFGGSPPTRPVECFDRFILGLDPTDRAHIFKPRFVQNSQASINVHNVKAMLALAWETLRARSLSVDAASYYREMTTRPTHATLELLRVLRGVLKLELRQQLSHIDIEDDCKLYSVVAGIFEIAKELERCSDECITDPPSTSVLRRLASTLTDFLGEDEGKDPGGKSFASATVLAKAF
ncbi:hypothetical protein LTR29_016818 [Friedmanniomyces endolithicus]|nr:hypothetical protein LTR29_016818 [Friedmanniomyces endolithicus]